MYTLYILESGLLLKTRIRNFSLSLVTSNKKKKLIKQHGVECILYFVPVTGNWIKALEVWAWL